VLNRRKHRSERCFPHKIDVSVPRDSMAPQLAAMLARGAARTPHPVTGIAMDSGR